MPASGWRRLVAVVVDCALALVWAGVLAAVVWPQRSRPALVRLGEHPVLENVVGFAAVVLPVTLALAWAEHRSGRTPGKRLMRLRVVVRPGGGSPSAARALVRNAVKIALPWSVGHAAVFLLVADRLAAGSADTSAPGATAVVLTIASYVLPVVSLVAVLTRRFRAPHDLVAGTDVVMREAFGAPAHRDAATSPSVAGSSS